ncbi:MAG: hypothetical protein IJK77_09105 [Lachnospiraceae bacterium]|nr:hypothetical protein [Lachnospiraceae bacterium]MBQ6679033.1 hypothetical protein [Lachnospiraceae bacterium]
MDRASDTNSRHEIRDDSKKIPAENRNLKEGKNKEQDQGREQDQPVI